MLPLILLKDCCLLVAQITDTSFSLWIFTYNKAPAYSIPMKMFWKRALMMSVMNGTAIALLLLLYFLCPFLYHPHAPGFHCGPPLFSFFRILKVLLPKSKRLDISPELYTPYPILPKWPLNSLCWVLNTPSLAVPYCLSNSSCPLSLLLFWFHPLPFISIFLNA